jgi:hypothetical protein
LRRENEPKGPAEDLQQRANGRGISSLKFPLVRLRNEHNQCPAGEGRVHWPGSKHNSVEDPAIGLSASPPGYLQFRSHCTKQTAPDLQVESSQDRRPPITPRRTLSCAISCAGSARSCQVPGPGIDLKGKLGFVEFIRLSRELPQSAVSRHLLSILEVTRYVNYVT